MIKYIGLAVIGFGGFKMVTSKEFSGDLPVNLIIVALGVVLLSAGASK